MKATYVIDNVPARVFRYIVAFLYQSEDSVPPLAPSLAVDVALAADYFALDRVTAHADKTLGKAISPENVLFLFSFADAMGMEALKVQCLRYAFDLMDSADIHAQSLMYVANGGSTEVLCKLMFEISLDRKRAREDSSSAGAEREPKEASRRVSSGVSVGLISTTPSVTGPGAGAGVTGMHATTPSLHAITGLNQPFLGVGGGAAHPGFGASSLSSGFIRPSGSLMISPPNAPFGQFNQHPYQNQNQNQNQDQNQSQNQSHHHNQHQLSLISGEGSGSGSEGVSGSSSANSALTASTDGVPAGTSRNVRSDSLRLSALAPNVGANMSVSATVSPDRNTHSPHSALTTTSMNSTSTTGPLSGSMNDGQGEEV